MQGATTVRVRTMLFVLLRRVRETILHATTHRRPKTRDDKPVTANHMTNDDGPTTIAGATGKLARCRRPGGRSAHR